MLRNRQAVCWVTLAALLLLGSAAAFALTEADISQLVFVEQAELPRMLVDHLNWLPDNRHLALGGWFDWPQSPVVAVLPNDITAMQIGTQAASPRFALSEEGNRLAFWKRVRIGQQDKAELTIVQLDSQMVSTLGEPTEISQAMQLVWVPGGPIVYATEDAPKATGLLYAADLTGGRPRKILEVRNGTWRSLSASGTPGQVVAQWAGNPPVIYAVNCQTGQAAPITAAAQAAPCPDGSKRTIEIDADYSLILALSEVEGVVVDRGVRAANWRPDGKAILYVKDHELYVAGLTGAPPRLLANVGASKEGITFLRGCIWSADGVSVAYWGTSGSSGRAWRGSLGLERVTARFLFPREAPVAAGNRIWVVARFKIDVFGNIIEPVWPTLKGVFTVARILHTPEGTMAEATNAGSQPGLVERVAASAIPTADNAGHIRIDVAGQTATTWTRGGTMKFRDGLQGWLEKTKYAGQPLALMVERQMLTPIGQTPP